MRKAVILGTAAFLGLTACTGGGPRTGAILGGEAVQKLEFEVEQPYVLIELTADMADHVSGIMANQSTDFFGQGSQSAVTIGTGDILDITLVLQSDSGFIDFSQSQVSPVSTTQLPPQAVGSDGNVNVPPLGRVQARGMSVQAFENFLRRRLGEELVNPSAIVRLADRRSARVSVLGDVATPGPYALNDENLHLIETLALAGGPTGRAENYMLSLSRGGQTYRVPLDQVYENRAFNVHLKPRDVIAVEPKLTAVRILGATTVNDRLEFDEPEVTLADVLAETGGLLNTRADLKGVFIYRDVSRAAAEKLGANLAGYVGNKVATVFRVDMTEPTSLFAASRFEIQDEDIVYVADSLNADLRNVFGATTVLAPLPAEYVRDATIN